MTTAANKLDETAGLTRITVPFEIKQIGESPDPLFFKFEGFGSTFGNIDSTGDRIEMGAFTESLKRLKPVLLFGHDMNQPLGVFDNVEERPDGLFVEGRMPKADSLVSGRIMPQMKIGSIKSLSIGFFIIDAEMVGNIRVIREVELLEISLVTIPANQMARITEIRSRGENALKVADLPIDFERPWDAEGAAKRIEDFGLDVSFPETGIADVADDQRVVVWAGVLKAAVDLISPFSELTFDAELKVRIATIEHYYAKAGRESPFRDDRLTIGVEELGVMTLRQLEACLQSGVAFSSKASKAFSARLRDADRDGRRDAEDLVASIRKTAQQIKEIKS